jgi:hypothetical protein
MSTVGTIHIFELFAFLSVNMGRTYGSQPLFPYYNGLKSVATKLFEAPPLQTFCIKLKNHRCMGYNDNISINIHLTIPVGPALDGNTRGDPLSVEGGGYKKFFTFGDGICIHYKMNRVAAPAH